MSATLEDSHLFLSEGSQHPSPPGLRSKEFQFEDLCLSARNKATVNRARYVSTVTTVSLSGSRRSFVCFHHKRPVSSSGIKDDTHSWKWALKIEKALCKDVS
ncbi:uncharacterized protein H6S33_007521 [Morchella sextelata]|uniref:uncharacterized protein n=1 Tax=Morchella sextelata TaxID=1174677 RepID=UPI001D0379DB|nr:uncharacterized protein H6S33_007521 [Morchella sextelata]KAH0603862.1 hypothetical protein H6S33_007521 [Morchella sextelata]